MIKNIVAALFLFVLSVFFPLVVTQAKPGEAMITAVTPAPIQFDLAISSVEYVLPYPGILPTHPLYVLKKLRDSIIEALIADPVKKVEFYILQADKKLNMAIFLFDKHERIAAEEQLTQARGLREQAVSHMEVYSGEKNGSPRFVIEKLSLSIQKHIEVEAGYKRSVEFLQELLERSQVVLRVDATKVINN